MKSNLVGIHRMSLVYFLIDIYGIYMNMIYIRHELSSGYYRQMSFHFDIKPCFCSVYDISWIFKLDFEELKRSLYSETLKL